MEVSLPDSRLLAVTTDKGCWEGGQAGLLDMELTTEGLHVELKQPVRPES